MKILIFIAIILSVSSCNLKGWTINTKDDEIYNIEIQNNNVCMYYINKLNDKILIVEDSCGKFKLHDIVQTYLTKAN